MDNPDLLPRTVVLLGTPGAGKSVLLDALLAAGGGAPASGAATELRHGTVEWARRRVHLLDPPGAPQLPGPLGAGLRAASAAVLVLSPLQGLDPRTVALWHACEEAELPLVIAVSQLDRPGADADEATALAQRLLGDAVLPLQLPLHDDDGLVAGVLDLLTLRVVDNSTGTERAADPEHVTLVENLREELLEAVLAGGDEEAFDLWIDGDEPGEVDVPAAVARGDLQPLLVTSPRQGVGLVQLLDLLAALPPAAERLPPAAADAAGDPVHLAGEMTGALVAEVVRAGTAADLVRIWSGSLDGGLPGDVVAVAAGHRPGDVLGEPVTLAPWPVAVAQFPVGVRPSDELAARVTRDPVARLEVEPRSGQLLLWSAGPDHAELLLQGLPALPVELAGPRTGVVAVCCPDWCARAVRSDATARGGEVLRQQVQGQQAQGQQVELELRLPAGELAGYALTLGRTSSWTATFTRTSGPLS